MTMKTLPSVRRMAEGNSSSCTWLMKNFLRFTIDCTSKLLFCSSYSAIHPWIKSISQCQAWNFSNISQQHASPSESESHFQTARSRKEQGMPENNHQCVNINVITIIIMITIFITIFITIIIIMVLPWTLL